MQAPKEVFHQERPTPTSVNKKPEVKYLTSWKEIANYLGKGSVRFKGMKRSSDCR